MTIQRAVVREMRIDRALEWAFRQECASVEFDEMGETSHGNRIGMDGIAIMIERGRVGCKVDGGGRSEPAWDAQIIASQVAALDISHGGKSMAVLIASLARAGAHPDWMPNETPRMVPVEWGENQWGTYAKTEVVETVTTVHRGRKTRRHVLACPVTIRPTWAQIHASRRNYLAWWGALLSLRSDLSGMGILSTIRLTDEMPPMTPWRKDG